MKKTLSDELVFMIPLIRKNLMRKSDRKRLWLKNMNEFKENIMVLVNYFPVPKKWLINVVASKFLFTETIMPYNSRAWSTTDIIAASKRQGFEILMFFNAARLNFLSRPAITPIVVHEMYHIQQIARNPKLYVESMFRDDLQWLETEADQAANAFPDICREEFMLESILYCYDQKGWKGASKMAIYLHEGITKQYGGGYLSGMTKEEYALFLEAKQKKDIKIFLKRFC
jgi:hypothetical protein